MLGAPLRLSCEPHDFAGALVRAEHGKRRQQHGHGEQKWCCPFEKRFQAQPEIKPDAAVGPGHGEQNELHREQLRARDPVEEPVYRHNGMAGGRTALPASVRLQDATRSKAEC